ncbi:MAG: family 20 glycosylhydrolase [Proteobacteria bacterium]|nr:family 20 glycosylhydrolase [Pseudomonadota bacterium]
MVNRSLGTSAAGGAAPLPSLLGLLLPPPREIALEPGCCELGPEPILYALPAQQRLLAPVAEQVAARLRSVGLAPRVVDLPPDPSASALRIVLAIDPAAAPAAEGYRLELAPGQVTLSGVDLAGVYRGCCTLAQWIVLHRDTAAPPTTASSAPLRLGCLRVRDWPTFAHRGVMLDVSRDRVPTMETLAALIDLLASWKINQLQLYTEHTFAYRGHEVVWREASPLTPDEIRALDQQCRACWIELVPNQNSLGHLHRWLVHEPYRALAECPAGLAHPFSDEVEPFSLCPVDPGSLALLDDLYDQLLPCFTSRMFNVGLDETFDLGRGRSRVACFVDGDASRVYGDFLRAVHQRVTGRGRRMQFWADIVLGSPAGAAQVPRDAIALAWGYEPDHPFAEQARALRASGLEFYVCPGTGSWNSLAGRPDHALRNLAAAARAGEAAGALGYLITDWGDHGHLQPLPVSYPGLAAGAALAWNAALAEDPPALALAAWLDHHALRDGRGGAGRALLDLGDAHRACGADPRNGTALFYLLRFPAAPLTHPRYRGLSASGLVRASERIDDALARLAGAQFARADATVLGRELRWVGELLRVACAIGVARCADPTKLGTAELDPAPRRALAQALDPLLEQQRPLWLARSRPGGLEHARRWLQALQAQLTAGGG